MGFGVNPVLRLGLRILSAVFPAAAARICEYLYFRALGPKSKATEPAGEPFTYWLQGRELTGYVQGEGKTVLLLHGWRGLAADLSAVASMVAKAGFKAVSIDLPGHGSDGGEHADLFRISAAVHAVGAIHGQPAAVVAHSFGAAATFASFPHGGPAKVVLVAPAIRGDRYMLDFSNHVGVTRRAQSLFLRRIDRYAGAHLMRIIDGQGDVPGAKFLVIHDPADAWTPFQDSVEFVDTHSARLITIEGAGHKRILADRTTLSEIEGFLVG